MVESIIDRSSLFTARVVERDSRVTVKATSKDGQFRAHLRNTGRLNDLIYPGAIVACERKEDGKTDARVLGALDNGNYVLLDTWVQEKAFGRVLRNGELDWIPPDVEVEDQVSFRGKRFDFGLKIGSVRGYLELKSAVTCKNGWASYPDAPSRRGLEHVKLLSKISTNGFPAYIVFIVTHPCCDRFRPNVEVHPEMANELRSADGAGVRIFGSKIVLTKKGEILLLDSNLPINLSY